MEELKLLVAYTLAISQIYEKVTCYVHMGNKISEFFNNIITVNNQGYPLAQIYLVYELMN